MKVAERVFFNGAVLVEEEGYFKQIYQSGILNSITTLNEYLKQIVQYRYFHNTQLIKKSPV